MDHVVSLLPPISFGVLHLCFICLGELKINLTPYETVAAFVPIFLLYLLCGHMLGRLQQWLRRKNIESPCEADSGPTASIRCPHGELMPDLGPSAKRILVPENLWHFIQENAMVVKPDDDVGCSAFSSDSEPCALCSIELKEAVSSEDTLRFSENLIVLS